MNFFKALRLKSKNNPSKENNLNGRQLDLRCDS